MTREDAIDTVRERIARHPVSGSPADMRAAFARLAGDGPAGRKVDLGSVPARVHGSGAPAIWLHGGGYVFGSPETHAAAADRLAKDSGLAIHLPAYPLAPEAPWPAALDAALAVVDSFDRPIPLIGDSAGGHLAIAVARRRPGLISALVLISPNTDRTGQSRTRQANEDSDLMNSDADDARLGRMAQPDMPLDDADVSPLLADLSGLPRTFVTASTHEVLLDDSLLLIRALACAGIPVTADITAAPCHMWTLWPDTLPDAGHTLRSIGEFLKG